jgi:hypothetical protein
MASLAEYIEGFDYFHAFPPVGDGEGFLPTRDIFEHSNDSAKVLAEVVLIVHESNQALAQHLHHCVDVESLLLAETL